MFGVVDVLCGDGYQRKTDVSGAGSANGSGIGYGRDPHGRRKTETSGLNDDLPQSDIRLGSSFDVEPRILRMCKYIWGLAKAPFGVKMHYS